MNGEKNHREFVARIKNLMSKSQYTQKQLAELCGVTEAAFSRYINMERFPKAEILANIATALNTTTDFLLTGTDRFQEYAEIKGIVARFKGEITNEQESELIELIKNINKRIQNGDK